MRLCGNVAMWQRSKDECLSSKCRHLKIMSYLLEAQPHDWCNDVRRGLISQRVSRKWCFYAEILIAVRKCSYVFCQKVFSFWSYLLHSDIKDYVLAYWIFEIHMFWFPSEGVLALSTQKVFSFCSHLLATKRTLCYWPTGSLRFRDSDSVRRCSRSVLSEGVLMIRRHRSDPSDVYWGAGLLGWLLLTPSS